MKKVLLSLITMLFLTFSVASYAAYPLGEKEATVVTTAATTTSKTTVSTSEKKELKKELAAAQKASSGKSKIVAALLAVFLGSLGVHSFYMGQKGKGFLQLGLTVAGLALYIAGAVNFVNSEGASLPFTMILGYLLIVGVSIWAFVDFIRILIGGLAPAEGFDD